MPLLSIEPPYLHFPFSAISTHASIPADGGIPDRGASPTQPGASAPDQATPALPVPLISVLSPDLGNADPSVVPQEHPSAAAHTPAVMLPNPHASAGTDDRRDDTATRAPVAVVFTKTLRVRNTSTERTRLQFRGPPPDSGFHIVTHKRGYIYPGECETVEIEFSPGSWEHVQEILLVSSSIAPTIPVQLHGFPALLDLRIPQHLAFGRQSLHQKCSKTIMLPNSTGVDFEFQISVAEEQPFNCFSVWPREGGYLSFSAQPSRVSDDAQSDHLVRRA
nr:hypothetical protein HK105_003418 [Polyrhizophydium stewartii]